MTNKILESANSAVRASPHEKVAHMMLSDEHKAIAVALLETFPTAAALQAFLHHLWPAYRAIQREQNLLAAAAYRAELTGQKKRKTSVHPPNERFCDLDGSALSDRQVMIRATHGESVKEKATGRIMRFSEMTGYKKGTGKWIEVT